MRNTSKIRLLAMVEGALMVALTVVLDLLPLPSWPQGGSITVAMIPVIYYSYRRGAKWGLMAGLVHAAVQMLLGWYAPPAGTIWATLLCILFLPALVGIYAYPIGLGAQFCLQTICSLSALKKRCPLSKPFYTKTALYIGCILPLCLVGWLCLQGSYIFLGKWLAPLFSALLLFGLSALLYRACRLPLR